MYTDLKQSRAQPGGGAFGKKSLADLEELRSDLASSVNPPEWRPSVSSATADRRSAPPRNTARMARTCSRFVVVMSGASAWACLRVGQFAKPDADSTLRSSRGRCRRPIPAPAAAGRDAAEDQRRAAPLKFSGRKSVCGGDVQRRVEARRQRVCGSEPPEQ